MERSLQKKINALYKEFSGGNIRINSLLPGAIETEVPSMIARNTGVVIHISSLNGKVLTKHNNW